MEIKYKEYYNKELENILKKYISKRRYGEFAEVLEDIFQRRAYEYDFSESEIENQVQNFVKNVRKIKFAPQKKFTSAEVPMHYSYGKHKIELNRDYFIKTEEHFPPEVLGIRLYSMLSHEVYHAIAHTSKGIGLSYYNLKNGQWEGSALDEVVTEVAAFRTNHNKSDEFDTTTKGYQEITFSANLLATVLGTTEKEFLKNGISNRAEFMNYFNSRFSNEEDAQYAKTAHLDKFEQSLNILYNLEYEKQLGKEESLSEDAKNELKTTALSSLYESCYELFSFQISSDKMNTSPKYVSEVLYRFYRMRTIMEDSKQRFFFNAFLKGLEENSLQVSDVIENSGKGLIDKIVAMYEISQSFDTFSDYGSYYEQFESAKKGMSPEKRKSLSEKYGIEIPNNSEETFYHMLALGVDTEYREFIKREDFDNDRIWDNTRVSELMRNIYVHEKERKGFRDVNNSNLPRKIGPLDKAIRAINVLIGRFKNTEESKSVITNDVNNKSKEEISEFDKRYRIDPQSLKGIKIEDGKKVEGKNEQERQDEEKSK